MDLDALLAHAAPATTPPNPALDQELRALGRAAAERALRSRRRGFRLVVAGTATAGVVAVGGAAAATGLLPPTWMPWSTTTGQACETSFTVRPTTVGNGEPVTPAVAAMTAAEKQQVVDAANTFLATYDYDAIDAEAAIATWREVEADVRASQPPAERQPRLHGADLELTAVGRVVVRDLVADLEARGLDPDAMRFSTGSRCDG